MIVEQARGVSERHGVVRHHRRGGAWLWCEKFCRVENVRTQPSVVIVDTPKMRSDDDLIIISREISGRIEIRVAVLHVPHDLRRYAVPRWGAHTSGQEKRSQWNRTSVRLHGKLVLHCAGPATQRAPRRLDTDVARVVIVVVQVDEGAGAVVLPCGEVV